MRQLWVRRGSWRTRQEADREFWQQMTGLERLEALEELQREIWKIMMQLPKDFVELLALLNARKLEP